MEKLSSLIKQLKVDLDKTTESNLENYVDLPQDILALGNACHEIWLESILSDQDPFLAEDINDIQWKLIELACQTRNDIASTTDIIEELKKIRINIHKLTL